MPFTDEDKKELGEIVVAAMEAERHLRRAEFAKERASQREAEPAGSRLFLVALPYGSEIAFPDEKGRAVQHRCCYARVPMKESGFYGGEITVVAYGDGQLLEKPVKAIIGTAIMVEVDEEKLKQA